MATPRLEPSIRVRLDGSTECVIARSGVHFLRGRETFFIAEKAATALAAQWTTRRALLEAMSAALSAAEAEASERPSDPSGARERG